MFMIFEDVLREFGTQTEHAEVRGVRIAAQERATKGALEECLSLLLLSRVAIIMVIFVNLQGELVVRKINVNPVSTYRLLRFHSDAKLIQELLEVLNDLLLLAYVLSDNVKPHSLRYNEG